MTEPVQDPTDPNADKKREILNKLLEGARESAYAFAVQAAAGFDAAEAIKPVSRTDADGLRKEAGENHKKAMMFRACAKKYADLLDALPAAATPASEPDSDIGPRLDPAALLEV